jgi:hypothetical protein
MMAQGTAHGMDSEVRAGGGTPSDAELFDQTGALYCRGRGRRELDLNGLGPSCTPSESGY